MRRGYHQSIARSRNYLAIDAEVSLAPSTYIEREEDIYSLPSLSFRSVAFLGSSVATSTSVTPILYFGRCTVSMYRVAIKMLARCVRAREIY